MIDLYDAEGVYVSTLHDDAGVANNIILGTRLFQKQADGRYVESVTGAQAVVPVVQVPLIRRSEDPSF